MNWLTLETARLRHSRIVKMRLMQNRLGIAKEGSVFPFPWLTQKLKKVLCKLKAIPSLHGQFRGATVPPSDTEDHRPDVHKSRKPNSVFSRAGGRKGGSQLSMQLSSLPQKSPQTCACPGCEWRCLGSVFIQTFPFSFLAQIESSG